MKFKDIKIFSWLAMALTLVTTSCRDDTFNSYWDDANSDEFTVTLNVALEGMGANTRADVVTPTENPLANRHIGDGSQIDMLVYAVYYYDETKDKWEASTQYVKEYEDEHMKPFFPDTISPGYGQTILDVSKTLQSKGGAQPITLTLKKDKKYKVVFWAQNHKTEAFVIDDLTRVQMKYKVLHENNEVKDENGRPTDDIHSVNNDEARDAFCRSVDLDGDITNRNITIYLKRPLAQINVGTRGFDYESITRNTHKNGEYLYSKIRINRAARYLNVVTDEIYTNTTETDPSKETTEAFYTIDYEYNKFPAFWKMSKDEKGNGYETTPFPSYTIYDYLTKDSVKNKGAYETFVSDPEHKDFFEGCVTEADKAERFQEVYGQEEFLKVRLFEHTDEEIKNYGGEDKKDDFYIPYEGMGESLTTDETVQNRSEEFKYISMCYILTNSDDDYQDVLTNVKVWMAKDTKGRDEVEIANLTNVPVQRNHRTNIVGSLLTARADMQIIVDEDFAGRKINNETLISGEITDGFYYDAEKDEFQISSLNGLLFFQQLVNGDLTVRQLSATDGGVSLRGPYPYKEPNQTNEGLHWIKYKSWSYDDVEKLGTGKADLLIKALKLDEYTKGDPVSNSYGYEYSKTEGNKIIKLILNGTTSNDDKSLRQYWPYFNNFSFYGATVKLMADIDLAGIEWIPMGFDCVNWDNSIGYKEKFFNTNKITSANGISPAQVYETNYRSLVEKNGDNYDIYFLHRRVFSGIFDGNGHTIYNLKTKEFGSEVLSYNQQVSINNNNDGPYDNVQWFGRGFFGLCGPNVELKNLRLQNVEVTGNNGVAGLVAVVSSAGFPAKIDNCVVDGGTIKAVPMYRHDPKSQYSSTYYGRNCARGVYVSGIVGQFCALGNDAAITNCEVRNVTISGFRRVGGIVGSIADQGRNDMGNELMQLDIKVEGNSVSNSLILCDQIYPFNYYWSHYEDATSMWKNGFGWGNGDSTTPMSGIIVGGRFEGKFTDGSDAYSLAYKKGSRASSVSEYFDSYIPSNNSSSNVNYSVLASQPNTSESTLTKSPTKTTRESKIENVSLENIPMLTSLFVDEVNLTNNYYGKAQLHTKINFMKNAPLWVGTANNANNNSFVFPIAFPNGNQIMYDASSPAVGMYVETVYISGENAPGASGTTRRSVITPTGVEDDGSCVMYVTARDRKQFAGKIQSSSSQNYPLPDTTTIKRMVLRGSPYAYAGIIFAPNANVSKITLDNVSIYDVYKTLALQDTLPKGHSLNHNTLQNYTYWHNYTSNNGNLNKANGDASVDLIAKDCNFRGYTVPGAGWNQIKYERTTFEPGSETRYSYSTMNEADGETPSESRNEFRTCKVEANTSFKDCYFKAPFYIDIADAVESRKSVTFTGCNAASAYENEPIDITNSALTKHINELQVNLEDLEDGESLVNEDDKPKLYYIQIEKDTEAGETQITYHIGIRVKDSNNEVTYKVLSSVYLDGNTVKPRPEGYIKYK